jgi:hypothetical protein
MRRNTQSDQGNTECGFGNRKSYKIDFIFEVKPKNITTMNSHKKTPLKKTYDYPCDDSDYNEYVATKHFIEEYVHNSMVLKYTRNAIINPLTIAINDPRIDYTQDCNLAGIKLFFDDTNLANDDIDISMDVFGVHSNINAKKVNSYSFVMYSLQCFKGIRDYYKVTQLELRKAIEKNPITNVEFTTVVLKGFDHTNKVVYHGDLTSQIPLPGLKK